MSDSLQEIWQMMDYCWYVCWVTCVAIFYHHHHVQEGLVLIPVLCILKMILVPPSLPWSSYVSSSFWFIL